MAARLIGIDTHVHVYPGEDSFRTLITGGRRLLDVTASGKQAVLILCEPSGQDEFDRMFERVTKGQWSMAKETWEPIASDESVSISIENENREGISIIRGQQIVTRENLEVLAFGHEGRISDAKTLQATIESVRTSAGHIVLPWGAGKWLGHRGRLIDEVIQSEHESPRFHLGDNGGRPWFWPVPQFSKAAEMNIKVLYGSDPLPIPHDESRIGTYASGFSCDFDRLAPWKSVSTVLSDPASTPDAIGSSMATWDFVRCQAGLRLRQRRNA